MATRPARARGTKPAAGAPARKGRRKAAASTSEDSQPALRAAAGRPDAPPLPPGMAALHAAVLRCAACPLAGLRTTAVPGEGTGRSGVMLVGEAPGRNEDETGRPFVGAAGKNLDLGLQEAGLAREDLFITSIVKCRPPDNRDPTPQEKQACGSHLQAQLAVLRPKAIVALGRHGLSGLLPASPASFTEAAGGFLPGPGGVPVFVSLHPASILYRQKWRERYLEDWRRFGAWVRAGMPDPLQPGSAWARASTPLP